MTPNPSFHRTCAKSRAGPVNSDVMFQEKGLMGWNRLGAKTISVAMCMAVVSQSFAAQLSATLLVDKIVAKSITKGLPLDNHETMQSGNGRTKQQWNIVGAELAKFEIIGDIQSDADLVGWNCAEYDAAGNYVSPVRDESFCRKFFVSVLRNVLTKPETVANDLLIKAKKVNLNLLSWSLEI